MMESFQAMEDRLKEEAYMEEEEKITHTVLSKLHAALSDESGLSTKKMLRMFQELDSDDSGELDHKELREGLSRHFSLNYTNVEFAKVLRVLDPDQSQGVDQEEFTSLLQRFHSSSQNEAQEDGHDDGADEHEQADEQPAWHQAPPSADGGLWRGSLRRSPVHDLI